MKATLIRVFIWPSGAAMLVALSGLTLLLLHWPDLRGDHQAQGTRDEFPGQRRGGGTHWIDNSVNNIMA
jgi:hypothetical protein